MCRRSLPYCCFRGTAGSTREPPTPGCLTHDVSLIPKSDERIHTGGAPRWQTTGKKQHQAEANCTQKKGFDVQRADVKEHAGEEMGQRECSGQAASDAKHCQPQTLSQDHLQDV